MINPDDEAALRLMVFKDALLAIATRQRTFLEAPALLPREAYPSHDGTLIIDIRENVMLEARGIVDTVVLEAQRLRAERKS